MPPARARPARPALGAAALLLAAGGAWALLCLGGGEGGEAFAGGSLASPTTGHAELRTSVALEAVKTRRPIHPSMKKYEGTSKKKYLERLRHRRWASQSKYARVFGYVEKWDDLKGEGLVRDQEKTQTYLVIRDEISKCYHNHKTLQRAEMVEFFATDEIDGETNLPMAKNITGAYGTYVKGSEEYRNRMLKFGTFPKRWQDTPEEYEWKVGEYYRHPKWRNYHNR